MWGLLSFRYGKTNRSSDDCQWKDSLLLNSDPQRPGHSWPWGAIWGSTSLSQKVTVGGGKMWASAFIVVSQKEMRAAGQVNGGLRLASWKDFSRLCGLGQCLLAWDAALRRICWQEDSGPGISELREEAGWGSELCITLFAYERGTSRLIPHQL